MVATRSSANSATVTRGRPSALNAQQVSTVLAHLRTFRPAVGLWDYSRIAEWVAERWGISVSVTVVRSLLCRLEIIPQRVGLSHLPVNWTFDSDCSGRLRAFDREVLTLGKRKHWPVYYLYAMSPPGEELATQNRRVELGGQKKSLLLAAEDKVYVLLDRKRRFAIWEGDDQSRKSRVKALVDMLEGAVSGRSAGCMVILAGIDVLIREELASRLSGSTIQFHVVEDYLTGDVCREFNLDRGRAESLTKSLLGEIASGRFKAGQRFYAYRTIMNRWNCSRQMVEHAICALEMRGVLQVRDRSGVWVMPNAQCKARFLWPRFYSIRALTPPDSWTSRRQRLLKTADSGSTLLLITQESTDVHSVPIEARIAESEGQCSLPIDRWPHIAFFREAVKRGYAVELMGFDGTEARVQQILSRIKQDNISGVALLFRYHVANLLNLMEGVARLHLPLINLLDDCRGLAHACVAYNSIVEGRELMRAAIERGHRDILVISGTRSTPSGDDRLLGMHGYLDQLPFRDSVTTHILRCQTNDLDGTRTAVERLFADGEWRPTVLVGMFAHLTLDVCRVLVSLGWRIPEDISAIAFGDRRIQARSSEPWIYLIQDNRSEVGRKGAQVLISLVQGKAVHPANLLNLVHSPTASLRTILSHR